MIYNFCAGPAMLPPEVLAAVQADLVDWRGLGRSLVELSHRTAAYQELREQTEANLRRLLQVDERHAILLLQGGASGQFAMVPYNFLRAGDHADYLVRGYWGEKAASQAARVGFVRMIATPEVGWDSSAIYAHITTNETIHGTRVDEATIDPGLPLCADMSSDILAAPRDYGRYALAYAGTQKNLGVAGLALVVVEKEFVARAQRNLPAAFCYLEHLRADGLYHTPNAFAVNALHRMTEWLLARGLDQVWQENAAKAALLYGELDRTDFWRPLAPTAERSLTNVVFRLPTPQLERDFLAFAEGRGLVALKGHRALGGIRASLYNAMPRAGVEALVACMRDFERTHG